MIVKKGSEHTILPTYICFPRREEVQEDGFPSVEALAVYVGSWQPRLRNLLSLFGINCQEYYLFGGVYIGEEMSSEGQKSEVGQNQGSRGEQFHAVLSSRGCSHAVLGLWPFTTPTCASVIISSSLKCYVFFMYCLL